VNAQKHHFPKCADCVSNRIWTLDHVWWNYSFLNVAHFLRHTVLLVVCVSMIDGFSCTCVINDRSLNDIVSLSAASAVITAAVHWYSVLIVCRSVQNTCRASVTSCLAVVFERRQTFRGQELLVGCCVSLLWHLSLRQYSQFCLKQTLTVAVLFAYIPVGTLSQLSK